ncbi:hypothetical protein [Flavobacterium aquidurense]|uniref:hypothetical protein n=1 Tax=Flavobacterium aquidurense TaxID=362413 RepID=UPI000F4F8A71|nr:hypothetical protein [Flavobacterium aquidurense]
MVLVDYLDVTTLFFEAENLNEYPYKDAVKITSYKELDDYFLKQDNSCTLYVSLIGYEWRVVKLFRVFTKHKLYTGVFGRGVFPNIYESTRSKYIFNLQNFGFNRLSIMIKNRLARLFKISGYIKTYDYIFRAGAYGHLAFGYGNDIDLLKANIIDVNTVDYDKFLIEKQKEEKSKDDYVVFLDQYFPYHPDTVFFNIKTVEANRYYRELNDFFDRFEKSTSLKVVIAAHPKAVLYTNENPFNGREVVFYKANEMVKDASIVLTHNSTAICFPICYKKRLVLLTNKYLEETFLDYELSLNAIKNASGCSIICMDSDQIDVPIEIDEKLYREYRYKYLTSEISEFKLSKDIFLDFISK